MSKPDSGHFKGTIGCRNTSRYISQIDKNNDIIATNKLDTREHPTKQKQLSSKNLKILREKVRNRTITKTEYKQLDWQRRLDARRKYGIDIFWEREAELIIHNQPTTRNWSAEQIADILNGKRPKYKGESMHSHHTYSVAKYPHLANIGYLIYPVTRNEHINRWHGRNFRNSIHGQPVNITFQEEF